MTVARAIAMFLVLCTAALVLAGSAASPAPAVPPSTTAAPGETNQKWMIEGAKRYRENCGRCHQPPRNFSPRVMAMAVRHMRVRALLTDDDMRYVIYYMSH